MSKAECGEAAGEEHGDTLHDGAPVEGPATTDPIQREDTDEGSELGHGQLILIRTKVS